MACEKCGQDKKIVARGMCCSCYKRAYRQKAFELPKANKIVVYEDYATMEIYNRNHELKAVVKIDIDDVERVKQYHWCVNGSGYAMATINGKTTRLHHFILDFVWDGNQQNTIDHINRDKLDNRKSNLRIADMKIQNKNRVIAKRRTKKEMEQQCYQ